MSEPGGRGAQPAPGWYPDPQMPGALRYWDGGRWTESRVAAQVGGAYPGYAPPPTPKTSGKAIASLVLGLVWVYGITSILAIIFAALAKRDIRDSNGWVTGGGMATAGLVLGIVGVVGMAAIVILGLAGVFDSDPTYHPPRDLSPNDYRYRY